MLSTWSLWEIISLVTSTVDGFEKTFIERESPPSWKIPFKISILFFKYLSKEKCPKFRLNIMSPCGVNVKRLPTDKYGLSLTRAFAQVTSTRPTCKLQLARCEDSGRSGVSWYKLADIAENLNLRFALASGQLAILGRLRAVWSLTDENIRTWETWEQT